MTSLLRSAWLALLLCACAATPPGGASSPSLGAYTWDLVNVVDARGQAESGWQLPGRPAPKLSFQDDRVNVLNLCNVIGAGYTTDNGAIKLGQAVATRRACAEPGLMALEQRIGARLPQARHYEIRTAPGAAPTLLLQFEDGGRWELAGTPTPATRFGGPGERVFMEVAPAEVACPSGGGSCLSVRDIRFDDQGLRTSIGEWRVFQDQIEGFTHEPGTRNVLRMYRYASGGRSHYVLDLVVESERVR